MSNEVEGEGYKIASIEGLPPAPTVILVGTQLGENIGTTARAMLNFGLTDLRLVRPKCGWPNVKALKACSGATEVLNAVRIYDDTDEATADLRLVLATTARPRDLPKPVMTATEAGRELRSAMVDDCQAGVLFGPERTGLSNDDLIYADAVLSVPLNPSYSSLNLAQAVLLIAYEWFQSGDPDRPKPSTTPAGDERRITGSIEPCRRGIGQDEFLSHTGSSSKHAAKYETRDPAS